MTDDADPSLGCQGCLCLPAWGWATRKETESRHPTSEIIDSGGPICTLQLFPSFSFCLIVRYVIAIGETTYCFILWFEEAFELVSLELWSPKCKIETIKTCEKWKGVEDRHVRLVWASSVPALQIAWKRGRAGLSLEWRALFPWDLHEVLHQTCSFHVVSRQSSCVCRTGMNANSSGRATTLPCIWSIYSVSVAIYKCMKMAKCSKSIYSL